MYTQESPLFTWYFPNKTKYIDPYEWEWYGGKWVVHNSLDRSRDTANKLCSYLDNGLIDSAKIWHGDPTALIVYSLVKDRKMIHDILDEVGAGKTRVWVYDSFSPNLIHPIQFANGICLMANTILRGVGIFRPL